MSARQVAHTVPDLIPRRRKPHPRGGWVAIKPTDDIMALYSDNGELQLIFDGSLEVDLEIPEGEGAVCLDGLRPAQGEPIESCSQGITYFIGGDQGPVKIGRSTNLQVRLKDIQTHSPIRLHVLAVRQGGSRERLYHRRFAAHRLHGEWFERCPEIEAEIERLAQTRSGGGK